MRASLILAFARVMRCSMVVPCTRKAQTISGMVRPATMRSFSATRFHRQRRVTADEDQPEPVVVDDAKRLGRVVVGHLSLLVLVVAFVSRRLRRSLVLG
ncbi:hypothetical protein ABT294_29610 [Nonomuraea sp. NPDC000554]|uniref:hypothetical protein n=1 Tax=Nonomuraea sp. NPDC000554 TaxID=3154259 RepID=UPI00332D28A8